MCLLDMKHSWTKNDFWDERNMKWRKWCKFVSPFLFNNTCGLSVPSMDTKCPNQLFYDWLVLNRPWKRVSLQIRIIIHVCSTGGIVELNKSFDTWITRNDVSGVSLFHLSYLITHMTYLWSQRTPNVQIKYFMFDWSIYRLFVLNTTFKRDSLLIVIFVNV
jgi:hypothetical protein